MNKIFKVIWNHATQSFVVVSELTKAKGKSASVTDERGLPTASVLNLGTVAFGAIVLGGAFISSDVYGTNVGSGRDTGRYSIAIGSGIASPSTAQATCATAINSTAIGIGAKAVQCASTAIGQSALSGGSDSIAIGTLSSANSTQSVALGPYANVTGDQSIAVGNNVYALGNSSISIGGDDLNMASGSLHNGRPEQFNTSPTARVYKTLTGDDLVRPTDAAAGTRQYIGTTSKGEASVSVGVSSQALGNLSTAFGTRTMASGVASLALGVGASSDKDNAIALGAASNTKVDATSETSLTNQGLVYNFAGGATTTAGDQLSIGSVGYERQIKNVAAGNVSATSTDAINGSQLYSVAATLGNTANTIKTILGGNSQLASTGHITMPNIGNTGKTTVHDAIAAVKEKVSAGKNTQVTQVFAPNGSTTYTVDAWNTTVTNGSKEVSVTSKPDNTNKVLAYTVDLSTSAKNNITTANATAHNANATANTANATANTANTTANTANTTANTANTTANTANATANTANTTANTANATANTANTTANKANTTANTALEEVKKGWNITTKANGGSVTSSSTEQVSMGELVTFEAGSNINLTQKGANITIATSDKPTFNTVTTQNFNVQNGGAVDMGGNVVSNVGTAQKGTDAVNYDLLNKTVKAASSSVVKGKNTAVSSTKDDNGTVYTVDAWNTTVQGAADVEVKSEIEAATNTLKYTIDLSQTAKQNITTANTTAHNANATANTANTTANNALTEVKKGWNITTKANGGNAKDSSTEQVSMGELVTFEAGSNINLTQKGANITIATSDKPTFDTVTTKHFNVQNGGTVDMGGNIVSNVGTAQKGTDAVNYDLLNKTVKAASSSVVAGTNANVQSKASADGTVYTVNAYNTTVSNATDTVTVTPTFNAQTNTTNYAIDLSAQTKQNITTANTTAHNANATANAANATVNKGWNITTAKSGTGNVVNNTDENVKMGEQVIITAGDNVNISQNGKNITIATSNKPTFSNVTTKDLNVQAGGTVNMGGNAITNVANGTKPTDAVNLQQLNASKVSVLAGLNTGVTSKPNATTGGTDYVVNGWNTTAQAAANGNVTVTSKVDSAKNIVDYTIDLTQTTKDTITNANVTAHNANATANLANTTANTANATVNKGWNLTANKDTTAENIQMGDTVDFSQGDNIVVTRDGKGIKIATSLKPTFTDMTTTNLSVKNGGNVDMGGNKVQNVANGTNANDAVNLQQLNASRTFVVEGKNANVTSAVGTDGSTTYTVNAWNTTAKGSSDIKVTNVTDATGRTIDYTIDLSDSTKNNITTANTTAHNANATANAANATVNKGWNITTAKSGTGNVANNTDENVKMGEQVIITAGDNVNISQNGKNITIATSNKPTFSNVTTKDLTVQAGGTVNMGGNAITNVANGTKPTDAVNLQQLNASKVAVLAGLNTGVTSKPNATTGGTDYVVNGWNTTAQAAANGNVTVTGNIDSTKNIIDYTIDLTKETKDTITNANVTAHNANATANLANTTANTANATVNKGWNLTANKDTTAENIQMGDTVDFSQGDNIIVTRDGKGIKIATSLKPTFTDMTTTNLSVKNGGNIDMGGNKVQNVANGTSANDAVNLQQLNASRTFVEAGTHANVTSAVGTDGSTTYTVNAWNTTAKGSSDIKVTNVTDTAGRTIDYTIDLSDSAKNNITTANNTANAANATVNKGWNITTAKTGTGNAENISDTNVQMGGKVIITAGDNVNVSQNGSNITIATSKTPTFTSVTAGNTQITNEGLTIQNGPSITNNGVNAGNKAITNVANGTNANDAVNLQQLNASKVAVLAGLNTAVTATANTTTGGTDYKVDAWNTTAQGATDISVTETVDVNTKAIKYSIDLSQSAKSNITTANTTAHNANATANTANATVNKGWNLTANKADANKANIQMGDTVDFSQGDNIVITQDGKGIKIATSLTPTFTDVTVGGDTKLTNDGLTIKNGPSITNKGIDAASKPITNVAKGVNGTDAVNLDQLNEVKAATTTTVTSKDNSISVTESLTNGREYDLSIAKSDLVTNPDGTTANKNAGNTFVTGDSLVKVLNNTSFNVTSGNEGSGKVTGTKAEQVKAGETVTFKAGNNLVLAQDGQNFTYSLSDNITLTDKGSIKLGNTTITDNNVTVGDVSVTDKGINAANTTISNVKDGKVEKGSKEAVNGGQLFNATTNLTNAGLNFVGNNVSGVIHKNLSDTLAIVGALATDAAASAKNVRVDTENGKLVIKLSENPTFTTVTTGNTVLNEQGLTINNGPSITNKGIDAANKPITNVAKAVNGTDAVNLDQLNTTVKAASSSVIAGTNVNVTSKTDANGTVYTVNAFNTTASAGSDAVIVNSTFDPATNSTNYAVDLSEKTKKTIADTSTTVNKGWNITTSKSAGEAKDISVSNVKMGDTVTIDAGKNINITQNGATISIATSDKPTFTTATVGNTSLNGDDIKLGNTTIDGNGLTINNGPSVTNNGIDAANTTISNVKDGKVEKGSKEAVNGGQLFNATTNLTNAGLNFVGNNVSGVIHKNLSDTLAIVGELEDTAAASAKNVRVDTENGKLVIKLSENPTFTTVTTGNTTLNDKGLTINNGPSITDKGIDAANKPITNVANGVNGTDAVNLNQLNETKAAITTTVTSDDKSVTVKEDLTNGRVYDISVAQADVVTTPNGTAANNKAGNTFVTGDNLVNVLNNTSFNVTSGSVDSGKVSGTTAEQVKAGETVTFKAGNNLVLAQDGQNFTYSLSNTLDLTDKGSIKLGNTTLTDNNVSVGNVSVTDKGINAANNTISNVKDGEVSATSKDAVNGSQLHATNQNVTNVTNTVNKGWNITTSASNGSVDGTSLTNVMMGDTVTLDAGKNINITQTAGKISIATSDKPTFSNVTVGDTKINNDGVTINNGPSVTKNGIDAANTTISNVKDGKVEAGSKEAVNGGQLFNATTNLTNAGLNFVGNNVSGVIHKNLSDTLAIVGELAMDAAASAKNVRVDTENGKLVIKLSENPTFTTVTTGNTVLNDQGLTIKDGPSITNNGIDAGNKQITNVAEGKKGTDAVNLDQLNRTTAAAKTELANSNTTTVTREKGADGQDIYKVEVNKGDVTVNNDGTVSTPDSSDSFATVTDVVNALNNVSWTIQGNSVDEDKVTAGNKVNFVNGAGTTTEVNSDGTKTDVTFNVNKSGLTVNKDGNGNVAVTANQPGDAFATAEDVAKAITDSELTSTVVSGNQNLNVTSSTQGNNTEFKVTLSNNLDLTDKGSVKIGNTTLNNDGLTVGNTSVAADGVKVGNVTINNDGIDVGGNKITNVANGTNATDAVNVSQLDAKTAAAKTELGNGNTTTVTPKTGDNGQTIYTVEVNKAPVTINSTTGVAETSAAGDKANNSFATVGDVVNALNNVSWTIQGNGADKDKVTAGNQVNFVNGNGTTAKVTANGAGTQTNVTFNVNTTTATITDGKAKVANGDAYLNATTVADLVNNTSWSIDAGTVAGSNGRSDYVANSNSSISAGEQVNYQAGQNIVIGGEGKNVVIATNPNASFDSVAVKNQVTVGDTTINNEGVSINRGPSMTKSGIDAAGTKIANLQDGLVSADSTEAVNGSQLYATNQNVTNLTNEVAKGWNIEALTVEGSTGSVTTTGKSNVAMGNTVAVRAGNNINLAKKGNEIAIATSDKPTFNTVSTNNVVLKDDNGKDVANINAVTGEDGVSEVSIAGNNVTQADGSVSNASRITNVAAGKKDNDAVNVAQLKGAVNNINNSINAVNNKVDKVDRNLRAGIAGAMAAGNLYHVTIPGKSMVAAGVGTYKGQSAVAVGYSRLSDNGKIGVKFSVNTNTRGDSGAAASVGYQW
ncbi:ESPR-type extended signal peptide-containing protein [Actinobacillus equuli]|uniref:ESPR-type extended signal peptide-containing protein n=1 Tax=Actinobacillus equuli TaxID=718 RepID=UPI00244197D8|nr:YadA-like family protein [Actinobacillus equuli]WGE85627.1 YadA-like family protein [Actinobacillus equuli subsp. haemolyticus]